MNNKTEFPFSIEEWREAARKILPKGNYDYIAGGSESELSLRDSEAVFGRWRLKPRHLRTKTQQDLNVTLLGTEAKTPILLSPAGFHKLANSEGELATSRGASAAGAIMIVSSAANYSLEDIANTTPNAPKWFQLGLFRDRQLRFKLLERAEKVGYKAIVLMIDTPYLGRRLRDVRNQFKLPEDLFWANLLGTDSESFPDYARNKNLSELIDQLWVPEIRWHDVAEIVKRTDLPVVIKGILSEEDAILSIEHGAKGIIVSAHGGRQLDCAITPLDALTGIVTACPDQVVILDGGVRTGIDALIALAIGAKGVSVGRPFLWGLSTHGAAGVEQVIKMISAELAHAMGLCGINQLTDISSDILWPNDSVSMHLKSVLQGA